MANESKDEGGTGIWLEVAEVQLDTAPTKSCRVQLKADKTSSKPVWWPVEETALSSSSSNAAFDTYKAILGEMDKKRVVLARLSNKPGSDELHCNAFRFQSSDPGNR